MTVFEGIFSHWEAEQILKSYFGTSEFIPDQNQNLQNSHLSSIEDEVSRLELSRYMRNQLLRDSDVMSMFWSLELRVPFVDRTLFETIANIPSHLRLACGKQILTQAVNEIPEWIVNHPKRGFSFPYEQWMQTEWQDFFSGINCPSHIPLKPWYRRWSLAILQHWLRQINS